MRFSLNKDEMNESTSTTPDATQCDKLEAGQPLVVESLDLFHGQREVCILHEGERYRLRITRRGKLILQK